MADRPYLAAPAATWEILNKYNLRTQKKFGQNFLIDAHIPEKIADAAQVEKTDCIIEIGPGIGTLTQFLAQRAGRVVAIEIDEHLIPVLEETLSEYDNTTVLQADVLKVDLRELIDMYAEGLCVKVVANLPYYITTPILMTMLEAKLPIESYTVMVQKEVAERMQAGPGG
ncbi:MAG: 16S rRNA (adenine(1518)-N(6)/adenine(1519)-N(6))-dimethyltransferase, partial [Eubacterium sp.]|nr:16S rRNA (adenine(1518)-N(6)/adenine(1519)-N(6))-dimethyltransferase [Eubacterium sp.]